DERSRDKRPGKPGHAKKVLAGEFLSPEDDAHREAPRTRASGCAHLRISAGATCRWRVIRNERRAWAARGRVELRASETQRTGARLSGGPPAEDCPESRGRRGPPGNMQR